MEYKIEDHGDFLLIQLSKDITVYELNSFKEAMEESKRQVRPGQQVIIDVKEVGHMDALALGALTVFSKGIREGGGDVTLIHPNDNIKFVFDQSHLSKVYGIFNSLEEAKKGLA